MKNKDLIPIILSYDNDNGSEPLEIEVFGHQDQENVKTFLKTVIDAHGDDWAENISISFNDEYINDIGEFTLSEIYSAVNVLNKAYDNDILDEVIMWGRSQGSLDSLLDGESAFYGKYESENDLVKSLLISFTLIDEDAYSLIENHLDINGLFESLTHSNYLPLDSDGNPYDGQGDIYLFYLNFHPEERPSLENDSPSM